MKSTNGIIWADVSSPDTTQGRGVAYGEDGSGAGLWIIIKIDSTILKSPDGTNWTNATVVGNYNYGKTVKYGKDANGIGLWIAGGNGQYIATSPTGTTWTTTNATGGLSYVLSLVYKP